MIRVSRRRWINIALIAAMLISLVPTGLMAQAPAPNSAVSAKSASEYYAQLGSSPDAAKDYAAKAAAKAAEESGVARPAVTPAQAQAKIHPDLRAMTQSAAPSLPDSAGLQAAAVQEPIMVQLVRRIPAVATDKDMTADLSAYFVDRKYYARPAIGKGEFRVEMIFGQVYPSQVTKLAYLADVDAILPLVLERNGQPADYPIEDESALPQKGPEDWAALRQQAASVRAGSKDWADARAFGDGKDLLLPADWFEVQPEGPHKASVAWSRGYEGQGVKVAVLDDGVDPAHPDLIGTQEIYSSTAASGYNGWPMVFSPFSQYLYFLDEFFGTPYTAGGYVSTHFVDTSATPKLSACGVGLSCFKFTPLIDFLTPGLTHTYVVSNSMSASGVVHVGTHPDNDIRDYIWGEKPAVLVTDPNTLGVYDTVYVDLDSDYDFRDEKPLTKADVNDLAGTKNNMVAYRDMNGDGMADISGGMVYYIADGVNPPPAADWIWGADCGSGFMCPGNGNMVAFSGASFDRAYSHGTQCASNIVGQGVSQTFLQEFADLGSAEMSVGVPAASVYGMAPKAGLINISDIYYNFASSTLDGYVFSAVGYDAVDQTGFSMFDGPDYDDTDAIQVTTNSYGSSSDDADGWDYGGQVVTQLQLYWAPYLQFMFSTGNGAPAYGTTAPPSPWGGIGVGASTQFGATGWDSITNTVQIMNNDVTPFSNRGPGARGTAGVDVVAGGAFAAGAEEINYYSPSTWGVLDGSLAWNSWGGTSRSAPVAGGVMALIYQAYKDAHGMWPDFLTAKSLLKSSATDLNYDIFTQGAGSVNADTGTAIASGMYGVSMAGNDDEWNPGDFRGEDYPGFAHVVYPGESWERPFTLNNYSSVEATVSVMPVALKRIKSDSIEFTVTPEMIAAESAYGPQNRDNFFKAFNFFIPITATAGMDSAWYNVDVPLDADLMIVRQVMPAEDFDVDGDYSWDNRVYLSVYNWQDINGDGNVWEDKDGNGVVNFINDFSTYGTQADGAYELAWDDPRTEIDRWEFGRFSYNRPTGPRNEMWVHNPADRMLDGLFIGGRHLFSQLGAEQEINLSWRIDFYREEDAGWLTTSDTSLTIPAGGSSVFTGTVNVPADLAPGMYEAAFNIVDPSMAPPVINQPDTGCNCNTIVVPVAMAVAAKFADGLQLGGVAQYNADLDNPYNNAAVRGLQDWGWRAESGDWRFFFVDAETESVSSIVEEDFNGTFPPTGWQAVTPTGDPWQQSSTRAMSGFSAFHNDDSGEQDAWLVTPSFMPTSDTALRFWQNQNYSLFYAYHALWVSVGSANPLDGDFVELVELGPGTEDTWEMVEVDLSSYAGQTVTLAFVYGGDFSDQWYIDDVFIGDVVTVYGPGTQIVVKNVWDDVAPADTDTIILGPTPTSLGSGWYDGPDPDFFGPYVLDTVGSSPNMNVGAGTWLYNTSSGTSEDWVTAPLQDGLHGFLQHNVLASGSKIDMVFTNTLGTMRSMPQQLTTQTYLDQGSVGVVDGSISLDVNGIVASAVGPFGPEILTGVPLPFVSSNTYEWIYPIFTEGALFLDVSTSSGNISDIDLGIFYCGPTGSDPCSREGASETGTSNEHVRINLPADGVWLAAVNNWSGPAGTFNIEIVVAQGDGFTIDGLPEGPLAANTPFSFTVGYDAPLMPGVEYGGLVVFGIPEAPTLVSIPVTVDRLAESAWLDKSVSHETVFEGMTIDYTVDLYNLSDPDATFSFSDPLPTGVDFVDMSFGFDAPLGECLTEDFDGGTFPPAGWVVTHTVGMEDWNTDDYWGTRGNLTPGSGLAAAADSDAYNEDMDVELWTPSIDLTGATVVELHFASNFQDFQGDGEAWVDVSTDGGSTWTTEFFQTDDEPADGITNVVDLSAYANSTIWLRFRYASPGDAWFWQIDDVVVGSDSTLCGGVSYPDFVYDSGANTITYEGPLPLSQTQDVSAWFEGFESGVPPADWILTQNNPNQTWFQDDTSPAEGSYNASVLYDDQLLDSDELLFTPQIVLNDLGANTLAFQSMGSPFWCRDDNDNCDLQVWVMVGEGLGDSDDILLGLADDFWTGTYEWSPVSFDLAAANVPMDQPVAFVFRYIGNDGAQVGLDAVELKASGAGPAATLTVTAQVNGDVAADGTITNTATLVAEHYLSWGAQSEHPVDASASSHVGVAAVSTSFMEVPPMGTTTGSIEYRIHVINSGDALADGVMVTATIPAGTEFGTLISSPPNQAFRYNSAANQVEWMGNLAPGEHRMLIFAVVPSAGSRVGDRVHAEAGITHSGVTMTMHGMTVLMGPENWYFPDMYQAVEVPLPSEE